MFNLWKGEVREQISMRMNLLSVCVWPGTLATLHSHALFFIIHLCNYVVRGLVCCTDAVVL